MLLKCSDFCAFVAMCVFMGSIVYSTWSGVNGVPVVLSGLSMRLLSFVHVCNYCRYGCMHALDAFLQVCVDVRVMSFGDKVSCCGAGGLSDVYNM